MQVFDQDIGQDKKMGIAKLPLLGLEPEIPKEVEVRLLPKLDMTKVKDKKDKGTITVKVNYTTLFPSLSFKYSSDHYRFSLLLAGTVSCIQQRRARSGSRSGKEDIGGAAEAEGRGSDREHDGCTRRSGGISGNGSRSRSQPCGVRPRGRDQPRRVRHRGRDEPCGDCRERFEQSREVHGSDLHGKL